MYQIFMIRIIYFYLEEAEKADKHKPQLDKLIKNLIKLRQIDV